MTKATVTCANTSVAERHLTEIAKILAQGILRLSVGNAPMIGEDHNRAADSLPPGLEVPGKTVLSVRTG